MRSVLVLLCVLARVAMADPPAPAPPASPPPHPATVPPPPPPPAKPIVGPTLLGIAITAAGAFAASQPHDESFLVTSAEAGGGAVGGAVMTALVFGVVSKSATDSDVALSGAVVLTLVALPAGIALGTWGVGELTDGSQHSGRALGGAFLGTLTGAIAGAVIAKLFASDRNKAASVIGFTLVGSTMGYQLLGGGPAR